MRQSCSTLFSPRKRSEPEFLGAKFLASAGLHRSQQQEKNTGTFLGVILEFNAGFALASARRDECDGPSFSFSDWDFAENVTFPAFRVEYTQHCL